MQGDIPPTLGDIPELHSVLSHSLPTQRRHLSQPRGTINSGEAVYAAEQFTDDAGGPTSEKCGGDWLLQL